MDELEEKLVDTVIKLGAVRRLREKHLRVLKILQTNGGDTTEVMQSLEAGQLSMGLLRKRRKELAAEIVKRHGEKDAQSSGGIGTAPRCA
jgi:hypothetical protein